jgi:hypothetical protein
MKKQDEKALLLGISQQQTRQAARRKEQTAARDNSKIIFQFSFELLHWNTVYIFKICFLFYFSSFIGFN